MSNNWEIVIGRVQDDECETVRHYIGNRNQCMIKLYSFAESLAKDLNVSTVHVRECKDSTYKHSRFRLDNINMKKYHFVVDIFESDIWIIK